MTEQLSCDAISIPEWKLELMAKKIFEKVWGNQNKAILRACKMIESCQNGKAATRMSAAPIQSQIEKIKKRKLNYAAMRADGELPREEYSERIDVLSSTNSPYCRQCPLPLAGFYHGT